MVENVLINLINGKKSVSDYTELVAGKRSDKKNDFTVVIPTCNRPELLRRSISSVLDQETEFSFEIIVVDNEQSELVSKSVDQIVADLGDKRILLYRNKKNYGMFNNWNIGVYLSESNFFTILNDDDVLAGKFIQEMLGYVLIKNTAAFCKNKRFSTQTVGFDELKNECVGSPSISEFMRNNLINGSLGAVFSKKNFISMGGYEPDFYPIADYEFNLRYFLLYGMSKKTDVLAGYGWGENESMRLETVASFIKGSYLLRESVVGGMRLSWIRKCFFSLCNMLQANVDFLECAITLNSEIESVRVLEDIGVKRLPLCLSRLLIPAMKYFWRFAFFNFRIDYSQSRAQII